MSRNPASLFVGRRCCACHFQIARVPRLFRSLHGSTARSAKPLPITALGPPPPSPAPSPGGLRIDHRKKQAQLLQHNTDPKHASPPNVSATAKASSALRKRFWKDVSVQTTPEGDFTIHLDARAIRHPTTKKPLRIPSSKPHLATAVALEWDQLVSAQQALKGHHIPLTSLAARAEDIATQDAAAAEATDTATDPHSPGLGAARRDILASMLRYLDTDTLLCWAPLPEDSGIAQSDNFMANSSPRLHNSPSSSEPARPSLRTLQERSTDPIIAYLSSKLWPGADLRPSRPEDDTSGGGILPDPQPAATRATVTHWIEHLGPWELAGLERAVLASKSLCVGARLVSEWADLDPSEEPTPVSANDQSPDVPLEQQSKPETTSIFGIEEAAVACSLETSWQTRQWGEVEDSHDVEREDLRRQLGSVILLVRNDFRPVH